MGGRTNVQGNNLGGRLQYIAIDGGGGKGKYKNLENKLQLFQNELIALLHVFQHARSVSMVLVHDFIIIGTTLSSVVSASDSNYSLYKCHSIVKENCFGLIGTMSSWLKINKRRGCIKNVLVCILCKDK